MMHGQWPPAGAARLSPLPAGCSVDVALKKSLKQFVKFSFVGASGVLVNLAVFNLTLLLWRLSAGETGTAAEYIGNLLGFVVSVLTNYYLNRRWTFRSSGEVRRELPKFFTVSVMAYLVNLAVFTLARHGLDLSENVSQLVAIACVMPINFVLNKLWSFRGA
jgi:dolichol-phosphate mannosyltransferase